MTVAEGSRLSVGGNGTTTEFNPTFRANSQFELIVTLTRDSDGTKTHQVNGTHYTVSFASGTSGVPTITFVTAPASGFTVLIAPRATYEQATTIENTSPLFGSSVEEAIDNIIAFIQDLEDQITTCFRAGRNDPFQSPLTNWKDRLDTYGYFNKTTGQLEGKALALIQADLGMLDQDLADIAALTPSDDDIMQRKAGEWVARTMVQLMVDAGVSLPDGAVGTPGIAFASDPDTGFYRVGANSMAAVTQGVARMVFDADGHHTFPTQPAFLATANSDIADVTGDGTAYTMLFNTEVHDRNADYVPATGTFTAPVTGIYDFSGAISLLEVGAATSILVELVTTNRTYQLVNIAGADDVSNATTIPWSVAAADMTAADTAFVRLTVGGTTLTVDIDGDASVAKTFFSGRLAG